MIARISKAGVERKVAVVIAFTLDRCDASSKEPTRLVCETTVRNMQMVEPSGNGVRPVLDLVHRSQ